MSGPKFVQFFSPIIEVLKELGGSGRPSEVRNAIAKQLNISEQDRWNQLFVTAVNDGIECLDHLVGKKLGLAADGHRVGRLLCFLRAGDARTTRFRQPRQAASAL